VHGGNKTFHGGYISSVWWRNNGTTHGNNAPVHNATNDDTPNNSQDISNDRFHGCLF
jgi:hypothetical protein